MAWSTAYASPFSRALLDTLQQLRGGFFRRAFEMVVAMQQNVTRVQFNCTTPGQETWPSIY
jgi:hypothetical protein